MNNWICITEQAFMDASAVKVDMLDHLHHCNAKDLSEFWGSEKASLNRKQFMHRPSIYFLAICEPQVTSTIPSKEQT